MFKLLIFISFFLVCVNSQFNFNSMQKPNPWSGNLLGGGQALGARLNYDTPRYGISGQVMKDFGQPGARVGVEGRLTRPLGPNTDAFMTGSASRNIGPIPKQPEYGVGVGIVHRF